MAREERPPAPRRVRGPTREALLDVTVGGIVLVVYALVQLVFLLGPQPFDPAKYFETAVDFPDVPIDLFTLRIGLVAPVRGTVLLFGPSEAVLYAVPIAAGLLLAASVYWAMLLLFGQRLPAAGAALATVLNTNFLLKSSAIFPDPAATATFTAGFCCLLLGAPRVERRSDGWAPTVAALCAGALFGWTYLIREFSPVILLPAVVAAVVLLRYPLRRVAVMAGAALAVSGLELLYGLVQYGDPLVRARLLGERAETPASPASADGVGPIQAQLDSLLDTIVVFPRLVLSWRTGWVFLLLVAIFVGALAGRFRDRRLWLLAAWGFGLWAVMAVLGLGSLSSRGWILNITNVRYWLPILPPLAMGAFGAVALLVPKRSLVLGGVSLAHAAAVALAALAVIPGVVEFRRCVAEDVWPNDPAERWDDLRSWFATPEAERYDVVWTDGKTQRLVPAFARTTFGDPLWAGTVEAFPDGGPGALPESRLRRSVILVHKDRFDDEITQAASRLAELRREWSPIFASHDRRMVLLAHAPARAGEPVQAWWSLSSAQGDGLEPGTCGRRPYVRAEA